MRFMFRISIPVEAGNAAAKKDAFKAMQGILEQQKPEAVYFLLQHGKRAAILILNLQDASQIAAMAEPWFLAFNAEIEATPVMLAEDLRKAAPAIQEAAKAYA